MHIAIVRKMEVNVTGMSSCTSLGHKVNDPRALILKGQRDSVWLLQAEREASLIRHSRSCSSLPHGVAVGDVSCMV